MTNFYLTKSRYMAGLQCPRRLWLETHEPENYEAPPAGSPFEIGQDIGRKARLLFPGGALVDAPPWDHAEAAARTALLMEDPSVPAIFEAAVAYQDLHVRLDVLERYVGGWRLIEVKSSSRVKDHHVDDAAFQAYVLAVAGVPLHAIGILHVNTSYVRGPGEIDWHDFFASVDVTDEVAARIADMPGRLEAMRQNLRGRTLPHAEPGKHCNTPYSCPFWDRCTEDKPSDWVFHMPRLTAAQAAGLEELGVVSISGIPDTFSLTERQEIIRDATVSGQSYVAPGLARSLRDFGPPACYLDFEAMMPPIPLYEGTRPYETISFQWSLHMLADDGTLTHQAFLADDRDDPRRAFAETLIRALSETEAPIIVYSAYERTRLRDLSAIFPDLREPLAAIIGRLTDLLPIVRRAVYLPNAGFSNSIKSVGPALGPDFTYDDLEDVADGGTASAVFLQIASGSLTDREEIDRFRRALLEYCRRDTLAMVEVHRGLMRLAENTHG